ncbi:alkaline phosphatase, tissue-nonspecific isozyme-like [Topomyia yanbarensis]|uniref:alkaline phosphatase, tissue-nonspecific isozyme-like n=1 Tax=Topomyia yanbarensis TaxID=2498891 RepID=UPI00273B9E77|nr:alkaline phosphatase, tissue-nonspecific isozyme-like [Topomyia yanbarensis]
MIRQLFYVLLLVVLHARAQRTVHQINPGPEREHYHGKNHLLLKSPKDAITEKERSSTYWNDEAQRTLSEKLNQKPVASKAKNIIFFIGDGMSPQTVAATRMYLGNENEMLSFEKFPHLGQVQTYCVNRLVPDSACTGTSYLSGVKINYGMLNLAASIPRYTCEYEKSNETEIYGLMKWAQDAGKATGIVTNTRITDATPAATYAHSASRGWEGDGEVANDKCDPKKTIDIAQQMVYNEVPKNFKVILGGGRRFFLPREVRDEEGSRGYRMDGRYLIGEWLGIHKAMGESSYVWNKTQLMATNFGETDYLLGLFEASTMKYNLEIQDQGTGDAEPRLVEMTEAAIKMLQKHADGFVLFVEGGMIDLAHHSNRARMALDETAEFSRAIELARKLTSVEDTLIVVSSDHSHTMTYNGYTKRGQDILGFADNSDRDGLPYTTLSYANGQGYYETYKPENLAQRQDLSEQDFTVYNKRYPATVPLSTESHGGEDVAVYASGPMSHIFIGNYEQNTLPYLMAYAAEIEWHTPESIQDEDGGAAWLSVSLPLLLCLIITVALWDRYQA